MTTTETTHPDMAAMMAEWAKYATPGPNHAHFRQIAGTWTAVVKHWMSPDAPADESEGEAEFKVLYDGRYLMQTFKGKAMEQPFEGLGFTGFDNYRQEYMHLWIDSMGTSMMLSRGKAEDGGKKITFSATMDDPIGGREDVPFRMVEHRIDDNTIQIDMFCTDRAGKEFRNMEIIYRRKS